MPVNSKDHQYCQSTNTAHIIGACGIEWDSPTEVGGRRKQQHITTTNTSQCH